MHQWIHLAEPWIFWYKILFIILLILIESLITIEINTAKAKGMFRHWFWIKRELKYISHTFCDVDSGQF